MKLSRVAAALALGAVASCLTTAASIAKRASSVEGFDVSNYQPTVNFTKAYEDGARFVIIKVRPCLR